MYILSGPHVFLILSSICLDTHVLVLNMDCLDTHMLISISKFSYRNYSRSTPMPHVIKIIVRQKDNVCYQGICILLEMGSHTCCKLE